MRDRRDRLDVGGDDFGEPGGRLERRIVADVRMNTVETRVPVRYPARVAAVGGVSSGSRAPQTSRTGALTAFIAATAKVVVGDLGDEGQLDALQEPAG